MIFFRPTIQYIYTDMIFRLFSVSDGRALYYFLIFGSIEWNNFLSYFGRFSLIPIVLNDQLVMLKKQKSCISNIMCVIWTWDAAVIPLGSTLQSASIRANVLCVIMLTFHQFIWFFSLSAGCWSCFLHNMCVLVEGVYGTKICVS